MAINNISFFLFFCLLFRVHGGGSISVDRAIWYAPDLIDNSLRGWYLHIYPVYYSFHDALQRTSSNSQINQPCLAIIFHLNLLSPTCEFPPTNGRQGWLYCKRHQGVRALTPNAQPTTSSFYLTRVSFHPTHPSWSLIYERVWMMWMDGWMQSWAGSGGPHEGLCLLR